MEFVVFVLMHTYAVNFTNVFIGIYYIIKNLKIQQNDQTIVLSQITQARVSSMVYADLNWFYPTQTCTPAVFRSTLAVQCSNPIAYAALRSLYHRARAWSTTDKA